MFHDLDPVVVVASLVALYAGILLSQWWGSRHHRTRRGHREAHAAYEERAKRGGFIPYGDQ